MRGKSAFMSFNEFLLLNGDELQQDCLKEEPKTSACPHPKPYPRHGHSFCLGPGAPVPTQVDYRTCSWCLRWPL